MDTLNPWEAAARHFEPRESQWATPGDMAHDFDPLTVQTPALDLIDAALVEVAEGRLKRLAISLPPQEGKSQRVSRRFPLWLLSRNPELRIVIASYELGVARRWGRDIRNDIATHSPTLGFEVRQDTSAAHEWQLDGHLGGCFTTGIGGALTGRPSDCFPAETSIVTAQGYICIRDLHESATPPAVLSFNHDTGRAEWRDIVATRAIADRPLVEVVTASGRRFRCTPDHRIHTAERGYVAAAELRAGERLLVADEGASQVLPLRGTSDATEVLPRAQEARDGAGVLQSVPVRERVSDADLRGLRDDVHEAARGRRKGQAERAHEVVLHEDVLPHSRVEAQGRPTPVRHLRRPPSIKELSAVLQPGVPEAAARADCVDTVLPLWGRRRNAGLRTGEEAEGQPERVLLPWVRREGAQERGASVPALRETDRVEGPRATLLLEGMQGSGAAGEDQGLPAVRYDVQVQQRTARLLQPNLRGRSTLDQDGRDRELPLQDGHQLRPVVQADEAVDSRARRSPLPRVHAARPAVPGEPRRENLDAQQPDGASHQREALGQPAAELDFAVQDVPWSAPQVGFDAVSVVRELRGQRDTVYDLQVEGNSNFFAEEVLVHNCLIIDDPHKNRKDADSENQRNTVWDWWTDTARTRLSPEAPVVVIQTRWHEDDLTGRLIADNPGEWTVLNIPAQANHRPEKGQTDPLGRDPGVYLESTRGRQQRRPVGSCKRHPDWACCDWDDIKADVQDRTWEALYQGEPAPPTGSVFKRSWWAFYEQPQWIEHDNDTRTALGFDEIIQSWDLAFKDSDGSDFVAGQVWGRRGIDAYLLDQVHARMDFVTTCEAIVGLSRRWPQAVAKLIEDKANGPAVINQLRRTVPGLIPIEPDGSKVARAAAVSPLVQAGNVHLPHKNLAPWVDGLLQEATSFPTSPHDDRVDAMSQALNRLLINPLILDDDIFEDDESEQSISLY